MAKFILSKSKALEQFNTVQNHCDIVSYSSKTNQDITKILEANTNCMFSVHFENELKHIKDPSRVMFLAQALNHKSIQRLIDKNMSTFIVDNESDLNILLEFLNTYDGKINLFLRIKLKENTIRTEKYFVFGIPSKVVNKKIPELKNNPKINELGIHFHRKTQNMAEWNLTYELSNIITEENLQYLDSINIGGGLPSEYANTNIKVLEGIFKKINELRDYLNTNKIKLVIEPGRFIAAPAVKLVTKIIGIHDNNIIIDASTYNSDMDALIVPVKLKVEGELSKGEGKPWVIKGITPCSLDLFRYRCYLEDPKIGQELIFINAGAYNFTTDFCDLEKIPTEVVE